MTHPTRECMLPKFGSPTHRPDLIATEISRNVRFSPSSTLYFFEARAAQKGSSSWYSDAEKEQSKLRARLDILAFQQAIKNEGGIDKVHHGVRDVSDMSPFGLEMYLISTKNAKKRAIKKRLVRLSVLMEQARTISSEEEDKQEMIAAASRVHSEWSRAHAQAIGSFQAMK